MCVELAGLSAGRRAVPRWLAPRADDNRGQFHNAAEHSAMHPDAPAPGERCAPWVDSGFELEAIRTRLAEVRGRSRWRRRRFWKPDLLPLSAGQFVQRPACRFIPEPVAGSRHRLQCDLKQQPQRASRDSSLSERWNSSISLICCLCSVTSKRVEVSFSIRLSWRGWYAVNPG